MSAISRGPLVAKRQRRHRFSGVLLSSSLSSAKRKVITVDSTGLAQKKLVDFILSFESWISWSVCARRKVSPSGYFLASSDDDCQKAPATTRSLFPGVAAAQPCRLVRLHSLYLR